MKRKKLWKWLSLSAVSTSFSMFLMASSCHKGDIKIEEKDIKTLNDLENYIKQNSKEEIVKLPDYKYVSDDGKYNFANRVELEEYIDKTLKEMRVNSFLTNEEFNEAMKNIVGFLSEQELKEFDLNKITPVNSKIYLGKNGSIHTSEEKAKESYFNFKDYIKIGNLYASSREELYNYLIVNARNHIPGDPSKTVLEYFLEKAKEIFKKK